MRLYNTFLNMFSQWIFSITKNRTWVKSVLFGLEPDPIFVYTTGILCEHKNTGLFSLFNCQKKVVYLKLPNI